MIDHTPNRKKTFKPAPGTAPGTLVAHSNAIPTKMHIMAYDHDTLEEFEDTLSIDDILALKAKWPMVWINICGLGDIVFLEELAEKFGLHTLAMEDVLNIGQRPKTEDYGDTIFTILRHVKREQKGIDAEQISMFVGKGFVLTFQLYEGDCFDPVRVRIRKGVNRRIRLINADYVGYALMDTVTDHIFPLLDEIGNDMDALEDIMIDNASKSSIAEVHTLRRQLQNLRQLVWPMREMVRGLRDNETLVSAETQLYLRDCEDHVMHSLDMLETFRERAASLVDLYLSSLSNKMNEIMKVLTLIATIFMPLGFIAGLYGMNFNTDISPYNMPETQWIYGYPFALTLMGACAGGLIWYFKKRGWLFAKDG